MEFTMIPVRQSLSVFFSITLFIQIINISAAASAPVKDSSTFLDMSSTHEVRDIFVECNQPIEFNQMGMRNFLRNVYSMPEYSTEFLPHSFRHFVEFLDYGKRTRQGIPYMQSAVRLFANKVKAVRYVTPYAVIELLPKLPDYFESYFVQEKQTVFTSLKKSLYDILYNNFLNKFGAFKEAPENFLENVSDQMLHTIDGSVYVQARVDREQLRQTLVRFLEVTLGKIIWSPIDQEAVWNSVKVISQQLACLQDKKIITQDELDDLYKSLIERFCHFLDIAGSDLSAGTINSIKEDIHSGKLLLLELDEQEDFMQTKSERLACAVQETEAKMYARSRGIITEVRI
jgi:hypothetical protein